MPATNPTINIDNYISIVNNVVSSTNTQGSLSGNFLTNKTNIIANGTSKVYYNAADVGTDFTVSSNEYLAAVTYFASFTIARKSPDFLLISGFLPGTASSPYLTTGNISSANITSLIALGSTGTFTLSINGTNYTATPNFTNATTLNDIATDLQTALITSTSINNLTVVANSNFLVINTNQNGSTHTINFGTDSSISPLIHATSGTGATLVQGQDAATAINILNEIIAQNRNWVGLTPVFDLSQETGFTTYLQIAQWVSTAPNNKYFAFVPWVNDVTKAVALQNAIVLAGYVNCTVVKSDYIVAAFILSEGASTDYSAVNGRINFAYKSGTGILPTVNNDADFKTLVNAGVTFYGTNSGRNNQIDYNFVFPVLTTGAFKTLDNLYNQVSLNDAIQTTFMQLLLGINNLPINSDGIVIADTAFKDVIKTYRNNGVIQTGNSFSNEVKLILIQQAGLDITNALTSNGYYLQFIPATDAQRTSRTFGNINFWYTNGQGVLFMNFVNTLVI